MFLSWLNSKRVIFHHGWDYNNGRFEVIERAFPNLKIVTAKYFRGFDTYFLVLLVIRLAALLIPHGMRRVRSSEIIWKLLLRVSAIEEITITSFYSPTNRGLVLASKKLGIRIREFQHGVLYQGHEGYKNLFSGKENLIDIFIVWSKEEQNWLSQTNYLGDIVINAKLNRTKEARRFNYVDSRIKIVMVDQVDVSEELFRLSEWLYGHSLCIKKHPRSPSQIQIDNILSCPTIIPYNTPALYAGVYSTMIIEKFNEGYMVALIKGHKKSFVLVRLLSDYLIYQDEVISVYHKTKLKGNYDAESGILAFNYC